VQRRAFFPCFHWHALFGLWRRQMKSYAEKLRDPRWQKKRLEVLNAASFFCEHCGADTKELHVHHHYYDKSLEPWEYGSAYSCLCDECHSRLHQKLRMLMESIAGDETFIDHLQGYLDGILSTAKSPDNLPYAIGFARSRITLTSSEYLAIADHGKGKANDG